ncbi:MAK10-like protein [Tanacetum coccineum]|uniref:MAK10-like protein n=1 Tax=Tanacetum coccineum TaxID=301880 RepID=A0ABQ5J5P0_9ASTR
MGDANPIRTLGDYSKPSHEGYRNTIELPVWNNVVPLRSDTIRLVQNGCSFHRLRSEDPNQHLKDFLKLVDSLDLDGSITTWEDLTTRFLAQFFPSGRTAKLRNDILMFQQHQGESLSEAWTRFKDLLQKVPHHGIDLWLQVQIFYDHVNPVTRRTIDQSAGGKLRDRNAKESWALLEDLALYDNESWNDPRDFAKPVKAISLPQDVPSTSDRRLIELENQVQRLMEAHLAPTQPTQVNKITTSCEICSGPHDTQYCMKDPEQAFIEYASLHTDEAGGVRLGKTKGKTYNLSHRGPVYEAILEKKITKKEDIKGNIEIPCNIGGLKNVNALVDQGSDVNVMPYSTYMKLTDERLAETDIQLFLASHLYIYLLGITKDVLVDVAGYVYPVDFMILDIKKDEKRPFILGTPFLTMAKAASLRMRGKDKTSPRKGDGVNRWRNKNFKNERPALVKIGDEKDDQGEVTKFIIKNKEEIFTDAGDGVRIYPDGVASPVM